MKSFEELSINEAMREKLKKIGITEPTEVQEKAIPALRSGDDIIVRAPTGTGKTLAFLLPLMEKTKSNVETVQTLIVTPTRELTLQISKVAAMLGEESGIKSLALYGGGDIDRQKERLGKNPQLIIGTPGRLLDHLRRKTLKLGTANKIVLDEADEMLKLGFIEDVELLLDALSEDKQILLFSATMPERVQKLAKRYLNKPQTIEVGQALTTLDAIKQTVVDTTEETKTDKLCELINTTRPYLAMVFCRTKGRVHSVMMTLAQRGYLADELHGDLTQAQRAFVMKQFREAKLQILVTTDIAARGIDVEGVTHVFNYDLPQSTEDYIHRIGRTGRAGKTGEAITFVTARQYEKLRSIEAGIKKRIDKARSERSRQKAKAREEMRNKVLKKEKEERQKEAKPLSKYANRKGASHKGRNPRSRRNPVARIKAKTNDKSGTKRRKR